MYIKKKGSETRSVLLQLANERRVYIEGPILKVLEAEEGDIEFAEYLNNCIERDLTARRKRLQVTKQVQKQNTELATASEEKAKLLADLEIALEESKRAESTAIQLSTQESIEKQKALEDLDFLQKRAQFKMMGLIVKMALGIIIGVGVFTTGLYVYVNRYDYGSSICE